MRLSLGPTAASTSSIPKLRNSKEVCQVDAASCMVGAMRYFTMEEQLEQVR
jgi:hypothetical protein